jgi:hypothetical protein
VAIPTIVGVGAAASGQGAITPAFPGGYSAVADDVAVTVHECDSTDTLNIPSGWALVASQSLTSGTTSKLSAIWRRLQAGDTAPSITDAGNHQVGRMIILRGCVTTGDPWDGVPVTATELVADNSVSTPTLTTTVADCLILAAFSTGQDTASTAGATGWANANLSGVTERMDDWTALGTGGGFSMATGGKATGGATGATTATLSLTVNFKALMTVAFKPASGDVTVTPAAVVATTAMTRANVNSTAGQTALATAVAMTRANVNSVAGPVVIAGITAMARADINVVAGPIVTPTVTALPQATPVVGGGDITATPVVLGATTTLPAPNLNVVAGPSTLAAVAAMVRANVNTEAGLTVLAGVVALPRAAVDVAAVPAVIAVLITMSRAAMSVVAGPPPVPIAVLIPTPTIILGGDAIGAPAVVAAIADLPRAAVSVAAGPAALALLVALPIPVVVGVAVASPAMFTAVVVFPLVGPPTGGITQRPDTGASVGADGLTLRPYTGVTAH